ncbi:hypothetical protein EDC96DRAFT_494795 [Choanephora cucurbitarum]|nr:hypothetical protein EDC96DRAFT_494795 [Choanephora cucurbitarum]
MASVVKYNSVGQTTHEMGIDSPHENMQREKNKVEIHEIEEKNNVKSDAEEKHQEDELKKNPGNEIDGSGRVYSKLQPSETEVNYDNMIEQDNVDNNQNKAPVNLQQQNVSQSFDKGPLRRTSSSTSSRHPRRRHSTSSTLRASRRPQQRRLGSQPSLFNQTFESTLSNINTIFNPTDPDVDNHEAKIKRPMPLKPVSPDDIVYGLQLQAMKYIIVACFVCYLLGRLRFGYIIGMLIIALCAWSYWNLGQTVAEGLEWQLEKIENMKTLYTSEGESVEWLNYMIEKLWRSINPEMFTDIEDLLEDTLQSVAPSFIQAIKVSDFDIGVQAPRIQMIRMFPPLPGQPEESIFGEASFSFHANPISSVVTTRGVNSTPPGLSIRFQTALKAPLDVKAELTAFSAKVRFKLTTCPDMPFISNATIAFTRVPKIETGVMPLSKHLNIMNLPTIKTLVNEGVKLGFADLVDPKSITLDVKALIGLFNQDTNAIGVVVAEIREATRDGSIKFQDMEDSYATISLNTQPKKTSSTTRVLTNDKNPRWNENLYILVSKDDILSETKIQIKVWDADKVKFDDMWGSVSIPIKEAVQAEFDKIGNITNWCQEERVIFDGWSPIDGKDDAHSKVKLNFKLSFHPKYPTPNMDIFSSNSMDLKKQPKAIQERDKKQKSDLLDVPVPPEHNNGILSVQIQQAVDLEIGDPEVLPTSEEFKHPYSPHKVVSPYAVLYLNDNKVYRTRTKLKNPSPHWNALTEQFIKDMENTTIRISIKNSVDLERDPVLGTRCMKLKDLFADQEGKFKEIQRWIPLADGIGFGKVLISLKYKPVKLTLPRELQGCDVGTLVVESLKLEKLNAPYAANYINSTKATLALNVDPVILKRLKSRNLSRESNIIEESPHGWYGQQLFFPLMMRYRTAIYVHISQGSITSTKATGRFWLKDMVDNDWQYIKIGLHEYISERSKVANRNEDRWEQEGAFGYVVLRMKIVPGFSPVHTRLSTFNKDFVGSDPFYDETLKYKAQKWIKAHNDKQKGEDIEKEETGLDHEMQSAVEAEKSRSMKKENASSFDYGRRRSSSLSSEYGESESEDEYDTEDEELHAGMVDEKKKKNKISKHRVVRKVAWSLDKVKHKVDIIREGFNSETRAGRTVAKEA